MPLSKISGSILTDCTISGRGRPTSKRLPRSLGIVGLSLPVSICGFNSLKESRFILLSDIGGSFGSGVTVFAPPFEPLLPDDVERPICPKSGRPITGLGNDL